MLTKIDVNSKEELINFFQNHFLKIAKKDDLKFKKLNDIFFENVDNLFEELKQIKKITIIGDYDVDGVCASLIMYRLLKLFKKDVDILIPNRHVDGYGLNERLVRLAKEKNSEAIITVDNGIRANDAIKLAKSLGLKVYVTDHHLPDINDLPNADVIIDPHLQKSNLDNHNICGAMLAFLIAKSFIKKVNFTNEKFINELAELAGIATITDVMPLLNENRTIVRYLLNLARRNETSIGVSVLMKYLDILPEDFNVESVSFGLGPVLNSAGRLESAYSALNVLVNPSKTNVQKILNLNNQRKELTNELTEKAKTLINQDDSLNVIYLEDVNDGIIGIIAGKIEEFTNKPTFVFTNIKGKNEIKGSVRSPKYCDIYNICQKVFKDKDYVIKFGGHSQALGLSLKDKTVLDDLKTSLDKVIKTLKVTTEDIDVFTYPIDFSLEDVKEVIDKWEPFGEGFPEPVFLVRRKIKNVSIFQKIHTSFSFYLTKDNLIKANYFFNKIEDNDDDSLYDIYFTINKETGYQGQKKYSVFIKNMKKVINSD